MMAFSSKALFTWNSFTFAIVCLISHHFYDNYRSFIHINSLTFCFYDNYYFGIYYPSFFVLYLILTTILLYVSLLKQRFNTCYNIINVISYFFIKMYIETNWFESGMAVCEDGSILYLVY